jgi:hypothetical protein
MQAIIPDNPENVVDSVTESATKSPTWGLSRRAGRDLVLTMLPAGTARLEVPTVYDRALCLINTGSPSGRGSTNASWFVRDSSLINRRIGLSLGNDFDLRKRCRGVRMRSSSCCISEESFWKSFCSSVSNPPQICSGGSTQGIPPCCDVLPGGAKFPATDWARALLCGAGRGNLSEKE